MTGPNSGVWGPARSVAYNLTVGVGAASTAPGAKNAKLLWSGWSGGSATITDPRCQLNGAMELSCLLGAIPRGGSTTVMLTVAIPPTFSFPFGLPFAGGAWESGDEYGPCDDGEFWFCPRYMEFTGMGGYPPPLAARSLPALSASAKTDDSAASKQRNVLFMAVDDLRPQIAAFGASMMKTPNIDRLAQEGVIFEHAYVQYSFCAPSRNSFLSGRRPDATQAFSFMDHFREQGVGDSWSSFPQYFRDRGYTVLGVGKLFVSAALPFSDFLLTLNRACAASGSAAIVRCGEIIHALRLAERHPWLGGEPQQPEQDGQPLHANLLQQQRKRLARP